MKKYILGINILTNASCSIMCDGEIVYVGQEERFNRFKNVTGFPHQALQYGLKKLNIKDSDIEKVGFSTIAMDPLMVKASLVQNFSMRDFHEYYGDRFWQPIFAGKDVYDYYKWVRDDKQFNSHEVDFDYSFIDDELLKNVERRIEVYHYYLRKHLEDHFGIDPEKAVFLDHHTCHAYYGYFGSPFREENCAVVTLDGIGDGRNQTVFHATQDELTLVASSNQNDIGRVYKMITLLVGMRPEEHEYKVMGMAPYAKEDYVDKAFMPLESLCKVEKMKILNDKRPQDLYTYLKDVYLEHRFDNICGAAQRFAEHVAIMLFKDIYEHLGVRRYVVSGGISMNIKMNKVLSELDFVDEFFVCGSSGDESLCIGACYLLNAEKNNNHPISHLYLGYDIRDDLSNNSWQSLCTDYNICENVDDLEIARLLADGHIVARVDGCAEFGARALGNRSILADPSKSDVVQYINEAVKKRDFWMPFALSVLEEDQDYCIKNPKKLSAYFMALGFDSNPENYEKFRAGTHPYDRTVRPQLVNKVHSNSYHRLISAFKSITGIPALLNTSFNLHGEPIVNNVVDVIHTFSKSGLNYLYLGNFLISKK
jgi:carbamoyltransferase